MVIISNYLQRVHFDEKKIKCMVVTYITKKDNTTFIIILMLLNRAAFNLIIYFNKYETDSYVCQLF